jgi:hypothetical protein
MRRITVNESLNLQVWKKTPLSPPPDYYTITTDGEWEEVKYFTKHSKTDSNVEGSEYVYILKNECMPGLLKIGYTYNDPSIRANQLFKTGVPTEFEVCYTLKCFNGMRIERAAHDRLKEFRVRSDREFFKVDLEKAISILKEEKENFG